MIIQLAVKIIEDLNNVWYLKSTHRHDYVSHKFKDGSSIFLDGGDKFNDGGYYFRSNGSLNRQGLCENWCLNEECDFLTIKNKLLWGTRGKDGKEKLKYVPLVECETSHLQAILDNVPNINDLHKSVIEAILEDRTIELKYEK